MFVTLKSALYSFDDKIKGQKVIAKPYNEGVEVSVYELHRVGIINTKYLNEVKDVLTDQTFLFGLGEFEVVKPQLQNCTDLSVGKGWEGYYDQKPIKKSKFR